MLGRSVPSGAPRSTSRPDTVAHMGRAIAILALLPIGLLALTAALAWQLGLDAVWPQVLGAATLGCLLGLATSGLVQRVRVTALAATAGRIADGDSGPRPRPDRYGSLARVARQLDRVAEAFRVAQTAASTDKLTQVANRPALLAHLFEEVERVARYGRPLSIAFIDLDHFKAVNDTYGHEVGDDVLRGVADVFRRHIRQTDVLGRYGGEEFVLVMPETPVDEAAEAAEKLRLLVLKERFTTREGEAIAVSVSIGVAGGLGSRLHVEELLRDADAAMYSAKSLGRNQTFVFAETDEDSARIPRAPISADGRVRAAEIGELGRHAAEAALAAALAPRSHYAGKPSSLIVAIAVRIAQELELPEQEVERIRVAAGLHDIGKVAVSEQILEKPGPLTDEEWQSIVQHPRIGQVIMDQVAAVSDAGAIILHHHERFSGHGYPHGLRGHDIPLGSRIVSIADAYDAMVRDRPYRSAIGHEAALAELRRHAATQFDPDLVAIFCKLYADAAPRLDGSLTVPRRPGSDAASRRARIASVQS
jgi:diguanylate cyclase (GGDEF)-like protein